METGFHTCSIIQIKHVVLCLLQVILAETDYVWRSGSWGDCVGSEGHCGFNVANVQTRAVWCENSTGETVADSHCDSLKPHKQKTNCFQVCSQHHDMFEWTLGPWGPCIRQNIKADSTSAIQQCGPASLGEKHRTVMCTERWSAYIQKPGDASVPSNICEMFWQKPSSVRNCLVNCSQDCVVSQFTDWSRCTQTCGNATKTRTRKVLMKNNEYGISCPSLSETVRCEGLPQCAETESYVYTLKVDPWGPCLVDRDTTDESPLVGLMTRELHCLRNDGDIVDLSLCIDGSMLDRSKPCLPAVDCVLAEWSLWSPCPNICQGSLPDHVQTYRTRTVTQVPSGHGQLCGELVQYKSCNDADSPGNLNLDCEREEYSWFASEWSPCKRQDSNSAPCGAGIQFRHAFCIRASDEMHLPMPNHLCDVSLLPDTFQSCYIPCPVDCIVSSWGPWDHCRASECSQLGLKKHKGHRTRSRTVIVAESHGGEACPHLYEHAPCTAECFSWRVGRVGKCRPVDQQRNCGEGLLTQEIQCIKYTQEPVESRWCEAISVMPEWEVPCFHPCPNDCVTSDWGNWSPCSHTCTGKNQGGMQIRQKTILAQPGPGGRACPSQTQLTQTRRCNDHSCALFAWQTEQWGQCVLSNNALTVGCGTGMQRRIVKCDRVMPRKDAPPQRCIQEVMPANESSCTVPCPVNCLMSPFSAWSECPTECSGSGSTLFTQVRSRYILRHPQNSGQPCPLSLKEERVCASPESCHTYTWTTSSWSRECHINDNRGTNIMTCGDGLYTRELNCLRGDGLEVDIDLCLRYGSVQPLTTKPCSIPCEDDCQFNSWSLWSQCTSCGFMQTRTRTLHAASKMNKKCSNKAHYPTTENKNCSCPVYRPHFIGSQSDCIISEMDESLETGISGIEMDCGRGHQYQAVQCMDNNSRLVSLTFCGEDAAVKKQACGVNCPVDCQIAEWTEWSYCQTDNETRHGFQTRTRALMPPQFGGRPCPLEADDELYQTQIRYCRTASKYDMSRWHTSDWGECLVRSLSPGTSACGVGMRQRNVSCLQIDYNGFTAIVNSSYCLPDSKPVQREVCSKPCDGQCIVSQWTDWSGCPKNCSSITFSKRHRDILRHASPNIEQCPHLTESQPCRVNLNCFQYFWNASGWSSCILRENANCGQGSRIRLITCATITGALVDNYLCEKFAYNGKPNVTESCFIECPLDCKMSVWSEWAICPQICGTHRLQTRSRMVIQNPNERGRPCPAALVQTKPCEAVPCYTFHHSEWGPCIPQGECGSGLRHRKVTCHLEEGHQVDFDLCLKFRSSLYFSNMNISQRGFELLQTVKECHVPCPGECERGDWSRWSDCNLYCINGRPIDTYGIQVRSRASLTHQDNCPGDEVENRTCSGSVCYEYSWKTDDWKLGRRNVWCQRSDGMIVTGSCVKQGKPNDRAICSRGCPVQNSFCAENELCSCREQFKPMYSQESGMLADCVYDDQELLKEDVLISVISTKPPENTKDSSQLGEKMFDFDFLTIIVLGTTAIVILVMVIIVCAICCCCTKKKSSTKSDDKLPPPQYRDYQNSFWDESAKMKYTGEIDL